jgi:hypothetical protein
MTVEQVDAPPLRPRAHSPRAALMPRSGAVTLADLIAPTLTLVCALCDQRGVYSVARLRAKHGDARLTDLRGFLTADCPQRARKSIEGKAAIIWVGLPTHPIYAASETIATSFDIFCNLR